MFLSASFFTSSVRIGFCSTYNRKKTLQTYFIRLQARRSCDQWGGGELSTNDFVRNVVKYSFVAKTKIQNRIKLKYHKRLITPKRYFTSACPPTLIQRRSLWIESDDRNGLAVESVLRDGGMVNGNGRAAGKEFVRRKSVVSGRLWHLAAAAVRFVGRVPVAPMLVGGGGGGGEEPVWNCFRAGTHPPARSTPNTNEIASPPRPDVVKTGNVARKAAVDVTGRRVSPGRGEGRGEKRMTRRECVRRAYREQPDVYYFSLLFSFYHRTYAAVIHTAVTHAAVPVSGCVGRNRGETGAGAGSERECVCERERSERERRRRRLLRGPFAVRPRNPDTNVKLRTVRWQCAVYVRIRVVRIV